MNISTKIESNLIDVSIDFTQKIDMRLELPSHLKGCTKEEIKNYLKNKDLDDLYELSYKSDKYGFQISDMEVSAFNEGSDGNNLADDLLKNGFEMLHSYNDDMFTLVSTNKIDKTHSTDRWEKERYVIIEFDSSFIKVYTTRRQTVCIVEGDPCEGFTLWQEGHSYGEEYIPCDITKLTYDELVTICKEQGYNIV